MAALLDPSLQPKFAHAVPVPGAIDATGGGTFTIRIAQTSQSLGLVDAHGEPLLTDLWGYGVLDGSVSYPGPTLLAAEGVPIQVRWLNDLPATGGHLLLLDTSIHWAGDDYMRRTGSMLPEGAVPVVTHLHGGHNASSSDGLPDAWFTQGAAQTGPLYNGLYTYENDQEAATLWYHDHALGITRLNVYAGLAGFYLLRDETEEALVAAGKLPGRAYEHGFAIQDRAFTAEGQLYLPSHADDPLPGRPGVTLGDTFPLESAPDITVAPEFFGDHILVNGMAWPAMDVDQGSYRFHLLNGSDSRFYWLELSDPKVKVTLIGSEGGLLPEPMVVMDGDGKQEAGERLILGPGERVDAVFEFGAATRGEEITLYNLGPAFEPFKGLVPATGGLAGGVEGALDTPGDAATVGQVMRFDVGEKNADKGNDTVPLDTLGRGGLNPGFERLTEAGATNERKLGLFEGADAFGRVQPQLGIAEDLGQSEPFGPRGWDDPTTEVIALGATEIWEIHNFTEDAHPIHLHLVQFQMLGRYESLPETDAGGEIVGTALGALLDVDPWAKGLQNLYPEDHGWQDTTWIGPGEAVRIAATFDRPGEYVWHCHVLSHEDHEMMRRFVVVEPSVDLFA